MIVLLDNLQLRLDSTGLRESLAILYILQHLIIGKSLEREGTKSNDLVEEDSVAPDIRHWGKYPVSQTLWRHPPHWQHSSPAEAIVITLEHLPGHPEVCQLDRPAGVDETVPAGHVSVHISDREKYIWYFNNKTIATGS